MPERWVQRAPWRSSAQLITRARTCVKCDGFAQWALVSNDDVFAFCESCVCGWAHPGSEWVDESDPYQSCPECSLRKALR